MTDEANGKTRDPKVVAAVDRLRMLAKGVRLGVRELDGGARIAMFVGDSVAYLNAEQADQLATDIRQFAIELRNGGRLT